MPTRWKDHRRRWSLSLRVFGQRTTRLFRRKSRGTDEHRQRRKRPSSLPSFGERTTLTRATAAKTVEGGRLPAGDEIVKAGPADAARALKRQCNGRLLRPWARNCASKDRALKQHVVAIRAPRGLAAGDDVALAVKLGADGAIEKLEAMCEGAPSFYEPFLERTFATRPLLPSFDPERTCVSPTVAASRRLTPASPRLRRLGV